VLTIVIPTLNAEAVLPQLLASIQDGAANDVRLIISDGGSTDKTLHMAAKAGAIICAGHASRGAQLARGADWALAAGPSPSHLLFLHADCVLPPNWRKAVQDFTKGKAQKIGYFRYKPCQKGVSGFIIKRWVDLRCWAWRLPYGDQGLLIAPEFYQELGGYDAAYPLFEDVEFVDRIRTRFGRKGFGPIGAVMRTDISDHLCEGVWRRGWRNFRLLRAYRKGAPVLTLYERYHMKL
jgi:glycosyltransferase involved in cell wall biosynthesis